MFINEFHRKFVQEKSRLFDALRRVSRLEAGPLLPEEEAGWPEWPQLVAEDSRLQKV